MSLRLRWIGLSLVFVAGCASEPPRAVSDAHYAWVEIGADGAPEVRAIGKTCPKLTIDGKPQAMRERSEGSDPRFPLKACEARVNGREAVVDGESLRLPQPDPKKIVVIGDTGCRVLRKGLSAHIQSCNDPEQWPFLKVARAAAAEKPDLVIHVGDYYYRESSCPSGTPGCKNSPSGDNWLSWQADFFQPANELLHASPWIFVRGNHESCKRGGEGWFRFLDAHPFEPCTEITPAYAVHLGKSEFVILDSSKADIDAAKLRELDSLSLENAFLLTHRPVFDPFKTSTKLKLPPSIALELAGHVHVFQLMKTHPPQIIAGNAGTALDPASELPRAADRVTLPGFGYLTLEKGADGAWTAVEHDAEGTAKYEVKIR